jgi:hypothetical protein
MGSDLTAGKGTVPEGVIDLLRGLEGVRNAFYLDRPLRERLLEVESEGPPAFGSLSVRNEGALECLSRAHVACIVKDKTFRPPPKATVVLIDDSGREIGRELLPGEEPEKRPGQKLLWLSKDFVIYYDGRRAGHSRFVLPPVPFREVEEYPGTARVCSSSPSTLADVLVKRAAGLEDDPKLATVLIGFDLE